jgi:hypothetical protein
VILLAAAAALVAGATDGRAASSIDVELTPLIGQVTAGGNIGYRLTVANTGQSTLTQSTVAVASDVAAFLDSAVSADSTVAPACAGSGTKVVCTPPDGKLTPGNRFSVDLRFTAPSVVPQSGQVVTQATVTVSAQTVGGSTTNGTAVAVSDPVVTTLTAPALAAVSTFLRSSESSTTGLLGASHPQRFEVQLPPTLFSAFGVALSLLDHSSTPICASCLSWRTTVTIPAASHVTNEGNPFYDGTPNPFTWSMQALYSPGYKAKGVAYLDDDGVLHYPLPSCGGSLPSATSPVCVDTLTQDKKAKTVRATGKGIENGNLGFG